MKLFDLSGAWQCAIPGQTAEVRLPGSLDENRVGHADVGHHKWHPDNPINENLIDDTGLIATRFTRNYTYEGPATLTRRVRLDVPEGKRLFVEVERARCLSLRVNGRDVPDFVPPTLVTPHIFEVTGLLTGDDALTFISDNSYPGLPHDDIVYSSMATDETQTNWNGLLGYIRLRAEEPTFIQNARVYPDGDELTVLVELSSDRPWRGGVEISSEALDAPIVLPDADVPAGMTTLWFHGRVAGGRRWDMGEGELCALTVRGDGLEPVTVSFGLREFRDIDGHLTLNGRRVFLRSEANCAVFPETGYPPMDEARWTEILETYRSYGVNCMRFHSHVPPEAAFIAADKLGMLMAPELCHWNPRDAFEADASYAYYRRELEQALLWLANHPSFVMLTFGNELHAGELGHRRMDELLALAHDVDATRLFANASNPHYGDLGTDANSDFYSSFNFCKDELRLTSPGMTGALNRDYPNETRDFSDAMAHIRERYAKPVFSFEVGQYEILPDFDEIGAFHGVTRPDNLRLIQMKARRQGLEEVWPRYVAATGRLSLLCYRAEVEAALRTEDYSGISLLGLQDFPGQGTALVGMLDSHLRSKRGDFAKPEAFSAFFRDCVPLVLLERYTYEVGERLTARVKVANYGRRDIAQAVLECALGGATARFDGVDAPCGGLTTVAELDFPLEGFAAPAKLELTVALVDGATRYENRYPIWVYPRETTACPENVYEAAALDEAAEAVLARGGAVYLSPPSDAEHLPRSIQAQFSTDFWSVGTFPSQSGAMGQLIDEEHPLFERFPTEFHTNWQWWPMARQRALLLSRRVKAIVEEMDSYATMRPMAQLFEGRCGNGRIMVSSFGLRELQEYPEARALQAAIYRYMSSDAFQPEQELPLEMLKELAK